MTDHQPRTPAQRTPLSLAIKPESGGAVRPPVKERGAVAAAIMARASENGIVLDEDPILAEALATVDTGADIPIALFQAGASVLSFVLAVRADLLRT